MRIFVVEPAPETFEILQDNIRKNGLEARVQCMPGAVFTARGRLTLLWHPKLGQVEVQVEGGIPGFGRVGEENRPMEVSCLPLDDIVDDHAVASQQIAFVWSATEGYKGTVIESGKSLWSAGVPPFVELSRKLAVDSSLDHGQFDEQQRRIARLSSYYEAMFQVPLLIRVPPFWLEHYPERIRNLEAHVDCLVSSLDLIPTIVDSLELLHTRQNQEIMSELEGASLLQPLSCDRVIRGTNFNVVRQWDHLAGFGIARGDLRFVFSTLEGPQAFDLGIDPHQKQNILESLPVKAWQFFEDIIEQTPYFSDMLQRAHSAR